MTTTDLTPVLNTSRESADARVAQLRTIATQLVQAAINLDLDGLLVELDRKHKELCERIAASPEHDDDGDPWQPHIDRALAEIDMARSFRTFARTAWRLGARPGKGSR